MLDILLLEDEEYNREYFTKLLHDIPAVGEVFSTGDGKEAIKIVRENMPDLSLLDIELDGQSFNGIEVARKIVEIKQDIVIVFITGYTQYALDSFSVHPYDYILKPVKKSILADLITNIDHKIQSERVLSKDTLTIKHKNNIINIKKREIIYIEKLSNQACIHTTNGVHHVYKSLQELEEQLDRRFMRTHKSYIVNLIWVKRIELVGRSFEVEFFNYNKRAMMNRGMYNKYQRMMR